MACAIVSPMHPWKEGGRGLVFIAALKDEKIRAFIARTEVQAWEARLPAGGCAIPACPRAINRRPPLFLQAVASMWLSHAAAERWALHPETAIWHLPCHRLDPVENDGGPVSQPRQPERNTQFCSNLVTARGHRPFRPYLAGESTRAMPRPRTRRQFTPQPKCP